MIGLIVRKELREFIGPGRRPSGQVIASIVLGFIFAMAAPLFFGFVAQAIVQDAASAFSRGQPSGDWIAMLASVGAALGAATFLSFLFPLSVGPDTVAGERERHTLETLLASPLPAKSIAGGKILAMVVMAMGAALVSGVGAFIGLVIGWGFWGALLGLGVLVAAPLMVALPAFWTACLAVLLSRRAKSVKAAQQALGYVMIPVFMVPAFGTFAFPLLLGLGPGALIAIAVVLGVISLAVAVLVPVLAFTTFQRHKLMV